MNPKNMIIAKRYPTQYELDWLGRFQNYCAIGKKLSRHTIMIIWKGLVKHNILQTMERIKCDLNHWSDDELLEIGHIGYKSIDTLRAFSYYEKKGRK